MLTTFNDFILNNQLFSKSDKILLAVSGGIDSIALSDLFYKSQINFSIAHCNFCLRADESDADEEFVKKLAKKYRVVCFSEKFDTAQFAAGEKISIQMAARMLRYVWFDKILNEHKFDFIATAHHKNDVLETVILNFTKGTGISGFHGIRLKHDKIIRPLLFADKELIRDYVAENQLAWREDISNESNKYQRNLIRNEVVPLLKTINPNLEETIFHTVDKVAAVENEFYRQLEKLKAAAVLKEKGVISITIDLVIEKPVIYLFEIIRSYNFVYNDALQLYQLLRGQAGKQFLSPTHILTKDRDHIIVTEKDLSAFSSVEINESDKEIVLDDVKLILEKVTDSKVQSSPKIAFVDFDKLKFPLKIRTWKEGDWFIPLGMNGKKKLSDFLIDKKIPLNLKQQVKVVTSGDSIIWVLGLRLDDRYKISDKTQNIYKISIQALTKT